MAKKYGSRSAPVKIIVLDILKPHNPSIVEFGKFVCRQASVLSVNNSVYAVDNKTESVKMTIEGNNINFDAVKKIIMDNGGAIHSIDRVVLGKEKIIGLGEGITPK
jgi:hypothetical protein|tara:strand:- start:4603 stop:4920 length:318 start_codon:yes stop_codon:yes gene_type:complete